MKKTASVERTRCGRSCCSTRARNGPPIAAAVPEMPDTAPATAALRGVARRSSAHTESATVTRISTPTSAAMARGGNHATTATPTGVNRVRAATAQPSGRQAMSRSPCESWSTGRAKPGTRRAAGIRSGASRTTNGAATTASPKPIVDCTTPPASTASPKPGDERPVHQGNARSLTIATRPMTTMTPRSTGRRQPAPDGGADHAADGRADGDEQHDQPVDLVARHEDEDHRGDSVDDGREHVLVAVEPLDRLARQGAEDAHQDDALGRTEVAAVDTGPEDPALHRALVVGRVGRARRPSPLGPGVDAGAGHDEHQPEQDQHRDDRAEQLGVEHEQQHRADHRSEQRHRREPPQRGRRTRPAPCGSRCCR